MDPSEKHTLGPSVPLLWADGPISFGMILSMAIVSWSAPDAKDLLISRCWEGVFLYPSKDLTDDELNRPPLKVMGSPFTPTLALPMDWDRDGADDLLVSDREGFVHLCKRKGAYPDLSFEPQDVLRDRRTGLAFNFPFENPEHAVEELDDLGGYIDPYFYNITSVAVYPLAPGRLDLVIGDWAGNLWWLPDESGETGPPQYSGETYTKPERDTKFTRKYYPRFGREYAKPRECLADEQGRPFVLGTGVDGPKVYRGANCRPLPYPNPETGNLDLLVLAGHGRQEVHYLERTNPGNAAKPIFRYRGEAAVEGMTNHPMGFHTTLALTSKNTGDVGPAPSPVIECRATTAEGGGPTSKSKMLRAISGGSRSCDQKDPEPTLCMSTANTLAFLEQRGETTGLPAFALKHTPRAADSPAFASELSEILTGPQGNRYLLNNPGTHWDLIPLQTKDGDLRLGWPPIPLEDQDGLFRVEAETDPNIWMTWGYHRARKWDYDGSGRQHLIVGTDKGLLYLLIDEGNLGQGGAFRFRSVGPLKDAEGQIIRIHNRACAAGVDLDGDGREDLIVGGVSYQLGMRLDPQPGAGFYVLLNKGVDETGAPILTPPKPLATQGIELKNELNSHVQLQVVDWDRDGQKEVILCVQADPWKGRIFKPAGDGATLVYTGGVLDPYIVEHILLDIDGDGELESVFGGGEQGIAYYQELARD